MQDPHDNKTATLLPSSGAARQAAYKNRLRAEGFKQRTVWIRPEDWQAGFDAGEAGRKSSPTPDGIDGFSWSSGWIEGDAKRRGFKISGGSR